MDDGNGATDADDVERARARTECDGETVETVETVMSKNARKRAEKRARKERMRATRKADEREEKRARAERVKAAFHARVDAMTEEERVAFLRRRAEKLAAHAEEHKKKKEARARQLASAYDLLIDCEFADVMSREKEWGSLCHQLKFVYERNCKTTKPFRLTFTGVSSGEDFGRELRRIIGGFDNWHVIRREGTIADAMKEEGSTLGASIVYLTADSENELSTIDEGTTYVIGGFIDRNRNKGLTLNKARELGVAHARLPISEHLKMRGTAILTVNQTSDVLTSFLERGDWGQALEAVVPTRKVSQEAAPRTTTTTTTTTTTNARE